jgi:acetyl-CoA carboxylase carboxyl transferase subunit alpha
MAETGACLPFERPIYDQLGQVDAMKAALQAMEGEIRAVKEQISSPEAAEGAPKRLADLERKHEDLSRECRKEEEKCRALTQEVYARLTPWERVQVARHPARPYARDYLESAFRDVVELHGDRCLGDDGAIFTGFATIGDRRVMVVAQRKGRDTKERLASNFGMARPEGYRKAMAKMRIAERFRLPVVCLVDTPGAYPGIDAEERGQAWAIAESILQMCSLRTPIVAAVIGEGGSGGALAIGVADRVLILENSYYSVISPEGCASILWKSRDRAADAAAALRITAQDLLRLGVVDGIIEEPLGGAHRDVEETARRLKGAVLAALSELDAIPAETLLRTRYRKYREIGSHLLPRREGLSRIRGFVRPIPPRR